MREEGRRYGGGEEMEEGGRERRLRSEQLMSSCVHHTHLLFSEVDVGQSEVDCVKVGGTGDIVHCSLALFSHNREREKGGCHHKFHTASNWFRNEAITQVCGCHGNSVVPGCPL